jgi:hypothetical protein
MVDTNTAEPSPGLSRPLQAALEALGLRNARRDDTFIAIASDDNGLVAVQVKTLKVLRLEDLQGRLAHAILIAQRHPQYRHLVVVAMPAVTAAAVDETRTMFSTYAPNIRWALVDEDNNVVEDSSSQRPRRRPRTHRELQPSPARLFSDLGSWMLKILLMREAPPSMWQGPRDIVWNAAELARVADVSHAHANTFLMHLDALGHLARASDGLRVVRTRPLLDQWFEAQRLLRRRASPVRWLYGTPRALGDVFENSPNVVVTGFEACVAMNILHASTFRPEAYITVPIAEVCEQFALEVCDARDAHFTLLSTRSASMARGRIATGNLAHVDALQAALDVVSNGARGREQAEFVAFDALRLGAA